MKTSPITSPSRRNIPWKIPAGLLSLVLLAAWAPSAQAAGCACSTKSGQTGAASCCGETSGQKSGDAACSCGSAQGQGGHNHSTKRDPAVRSAKGAQKTQESQRGEIPDFAKRALAALQAGDMVAAESILDTQYRQMKAASAPGQVKLAVATGLVRLAGNLRDKEQQALRKNTMDRALALSDEVIEAAAGSEKATALVIKARILKQAKGSEAEIQTLVETARAIDPENRDLLRFARQDSRPGR